MPAVRSLACAVLVPIVVAVLVGCSSSDGGDDRVADDTTSIPTTAPDVIVVEDTVQLGLDGITAADGTVLTYTADERACVAQAVPDAPDPADDPDAEQVVAEAALGCLGFDRVAPFVTQQLAADEALTGVDPTCLAREVASLQDTPDILAAVLRGEPDTTSVIANTAAINCT